MSGPLDSVSLTPWTGSSSSFNFSVPDISTDLGLSDFTAPDTTLSSNYLDNGPIPLNQVDLGPLPAINLSLPSSASPQLVYNPQTGASDTGMSTTDWLGAIANLANVGAQTYATVNNLATPAQVAAAEQTAVAQSQAAAAAAAAGETPASGFSLASFIDFSTPWPYVGLAGVAVGLAMLLPAKKKK